MFSRAHQLSLEFSTPEAAAWRVLREVQKGGARFERVAFTRNRRVMASAVDHGRTLRVHELFAEAPAEVLRALGENFGARRAAVRDRARAVVRAFLRGVNGVPELETPPRRPEEPRPGDIPHIERLTREFDQINDRFFDGLLPPVPIRLSGRMRSRLGHFSSEPLEIAISRSLCVRGKHHEAEHTLRHEMIHLWQWRVGKKPGHRSDFRQWAAALGITPRATRPLC